MFKSHYHHCLPNKKTTCGIKNIDVCVLHHKQKKQKQSNTLRQEDLCLSSFLPLINHSKKKKQTNFGGADENESIKCLLAFKSNGHVDSLANVFDFTMSVSQVTLAPATSSAALGDVAL